MFGAGMRGSVPWGWGRSIPQPWAVAAGRGGSELSRLPFPARYDVLFMPPSFPFGGMENPCITFVTPCLLAGDRSLVDVIIHEISHSWFGNLVTNATWGEFWLNEGFTMYAQRRISTEVYGAWPCPGRLRGFGVRAICWPGSCSPSQQGSRRLPLVAAPVTLSLRAGRGLQTPPLVPARFSVHLPGGRHGQGPAAPAHGQHRGGPSAQQAPGGDRARSVAAPAGGAGGARGCAGLCSLRKG